MRVGLLADVLNGRSGARAAIMLGEALGNIEGCEVVFFGSNALLDNSTLEKLKQKFTVHIFEKPGLISLKLAKVLREEKLDFISAHCSLRILISAYLSGIKIVRTDYGTQFPSLNGDFGSWKIGLFNKALYYFADIFVYFRDFAKFFFSNKVVGISEDNAKKIKKLYRLTVPYIYLGSNNFLCGVKSPVNQAASPSFISILSVSRFVPYKGFHILVEAFKSLQEKYPQIRLFLVGGQGKGRYFNYLKSLIKDDDKISLIFNPSDEALLGLYKSCQIYACCTRWEGLGLPFIEASSFGLANLGFSFFGPAHEVIQDGKTGLLAKDESEFKDFLERLIKEGGTRETMGESGREFSRNFSWESCARSYFNIFKAL